MAEHAQRTGGRFFAQPRSAPGRLSVIALIVAVVLVVANVVFFNAPNEIGPA